MRSLLKVTDPFWSHGPGLKQRRNTLPHPYPLPLGEGESITEAVENLRRSWFNDGTEKQTMRWLFPLPQGEGQGEGE